jgi:hypothetical protein
MKNPKASPWSFRNIWRQTLIRSVVSVTIFSNFQRKILLGRCRDAFSKRFRNIVGSGLIPMMQVKLWKQRRYCWICRSKNGTNKKRCQSALKTDPL